MFERANEASDHQQLLMTTFKAVAKKHGMECLFHEKPFAGVNGSGKHVNFSLGNSDSGQPARARRHPARQRPVPGVLRRGHPRRAQVRRPAARRRSPRRSNDHRLGANEAPPAIISIFLGDQLADVFDQIAKGGATRSKEKGTLTIGVDTLPDLHQGPGRPQPHQSPFAFTGNRFEFRAPGSDADRRRPDGHAQHDHGRGARLLRHRRSRPPSPPAPTSTRPSRRCSTEIIADHGAVDLQRQRLLRRVADRGRAARAEEPAHHRRRPARADLARGHRAVRASTASSTTARCTAATRSASSSTS